MSSTASASAAVASSEQRRNALQAEINKYVADGYIVVSQTDATAQLLKKKKFSLVMCLLLVGVLYIPFYLAKKDKRVYLQVDERGRVTAS